MRIGESLQWGLSTDGTGNNPKTTVNFPISFGTCYAVIPINSYTGGADYFGLSVTAITKSNFSTANGGYGDNKLWFVATGRT